MPSCYRIAAMLLVALLGAAPAVAQYLFLDNSVLEVMNKQDVEDLRQAIRQAVEKEPDGHTVAWSNPASGAFGTVTPVRSYQGKQGLPCRTVEIYTKAKDRDSRGKWEFCKSGTRWGIAS
jgi:surface antigen